MTQQHVAAAARAVASDPARTGPRLLIAALALVALWLVPAAPAAAHAVLLETAPADGAVLDAAPAQVSARFNEGIDLPQQAFRVFDASGERVDSGTPCLTDPSTAAVDLRDDLPDGAYIAAWRVISADGHVVSGSFVFAVGDGAAIDRSALSAFGDDDAATWAVVAAATGRWVTYTGTLLAVGGALFLLLAHDRRGGERDRLVRIVRSAALAGAAGTALGVPLQAVLTSGLGASALVDGALLLDTMASGYGASAGLRLAGLAVIFLGAARLWDTRAVALCTVGSLVALASFLLTGHTAASEPRALVLGSNLVHTTAAAIWFGGLVLLAVVLRARRRDGQTALGVARVVARFSTLAVLSVLAVTAAGFALAWVEVRTVEGLTSTAYGWTLLAKTALVAGLVALGAYNNRRLVPAIRRGADRAWERLTRIVRLEVGGVVAVLLVTAVLVNLVPARVEAGLGVPYAAVLELDDDHRVDLVVDPARPGRNEVHLYLLDEAGRPADIAQEVEVRFSLPGAEIGGLAREPMRAGPGHYLQVGSELSIAGRWEVEVRVLVSDFDLRTVTAEVPVGTGG
jgi:copper transport protein